MANKGAECLQMIYMAAYPIFFGVSDLIGSWDQAAGVVANHHDQFHHVISHFGYHLVIDAILNFLRSGVFEYEPTVESTFSELFEVPEPSDILPTFNLPYCPPTCTSTHNSQYSEQMDTHSGVTTPCDSTYGSLDYAVTNSLVTLAIPLQTASSNPEMIHSVINQNQPYRSADSLPFEIQHLWLTLMQNLLEKCCYDFTSKACPDLLKENKWTSALCVELHKWCEELPKKFYTFPAGTTTARTHSDFKCTLFPAKMIRHKAVHREFVDNAEILSLLEAGIQVARMLKDELCTFKLEKLKTCLLSPAQSSNAEHLRTICSALEKSALHAILACNTDDADSSKFKNTNNLRTQRKKPDRQFIKKIWRCLKLVECPLSVRQKKTVSDWWNLMMEKDVRRLQKAIAGS